MPQQRARNWTVPTILLCSYGFFLYFNFAVQFLTPYLLGPRKNLTEEELNNQVYPVWSYAYTAFLIPIFLLTDYLRYKPVIILQGAAYIGCYCLLIFATGVPLMKLMQVIYGIATAGEIGYYSYIYSVVDEDYYQKATSYVRASNQVGLFLGSVVSQILVSVAYVDYFYLFIITLVNVSVAFIISLFLPFPKRSMYFYKKGLASEEGGNGGNSTPSGEENAPSAPLNTDSNTSEESLILSKWKLVLWQLWLDLKRCYSTQSLLRWSIWWALSTCGWILVVNYIQVLWWKKIESEDKNSTLVNHDSANNSNTLDNHDSSVNNRTSGSPNSEVYNGAVEALAQILGAISAFAVGYMKVNWKNWGELLLGFGSVMKCGLMLLMYSTENIWICYIAYVLFIALYNFVITVTQFQIAVGLSTERFALVFGMNTFFAVVLNSILTLIVVDSAGLGLDVTTQFVVYSGYFGFIAIAYLAHAVYDICERQFVVGNEPEEQSENRNQESLL